MAWQEADRHARAAAAGGAGGGSEDGGDGWRRGWRDRRLLGQTRAQGLGSHLDRGGDRRHPDPQAPADPSLPGIGLLIFDEFHERSLDGDLGLAMALDVQAALRNDLRILVMSATLDEARLSEYLGGAPDVVRRQDGYFRSKPDTASGRKGGRSPMR